MKEKILISYAIPKEGIEALEQHFELIYPDKEYFTEEEIIQQIPDCIGLLSFFSHPISKEVIGAGKQLQIISNYGVGFNNIDIDSASKKGIVVCNTPESVCEPTAELCLGLMLAAARRIAECNHALRTQDDFKWGAMLNLGDTLRNKTLGIIGLGKIGLSVAKKAEAFGMKVIYHNRKAKNVAYEYVSFEKLLQTADYISLHCPLNNETKHLIGEQELQQMKSSAYVINTARGPVINEEALAKALLNNDIAGAALDVFEKEPTIHPQLYKCQNAVLVPHIGTATQATRIEMGKEASENLLSFLLQGKAKNKVN